MPSKHVVQQGEDLFVIAARYGFRDYRTIYDDAANAELRSLRPNPQVLFPGDVIAIPDREPRVEEGDTGRRHRFFVRAPQRLLRLRLRDPFGEPLVNEPYELVVDGVSVGSGLVTKPDGTLEHVIPTQARRGRLTTKDFAWDLRIGDLDPIRETPDSGRSGMQARLRNLGYYHGLLDGIVGPRTEDALRRFQADHGLAVTGALDDATSAALIAAHGC
jgi:N-acetylmuramoyl-L-alanine amidase